MRPEAHPAIQRPAGLINWWRCRWRAAREVDPRDVARGPCDPDARPGHAASRPGEQLMGLASPCHSAPSSRPPPPRPTRPRRLTQTAVLFLCLLLILRVWGVQPYEVPTGSMAPALLGRHRECACPRCGYPVV